MLLFLVILSNNGLFHSYKCNRNEMPMSSMHQEENDTVMKKFNSNRWSDYEMSRSRRGSRCLVLVSCSLYLNYSFASARSSLRSVDGKKPEHLVVRQENSSEQLCHSLHVENALHARSTCF